MDVARLEFYAGSTLVFAGLVLAVASVMSIGQAQSWDVADAFAAESIRQVRRTGMLLVVLGLPMLVAATPGLMVRVARTAGFPWVMIGWVAFAVGTVLFAMALGLTAIAMPALGELAQMGSLSPQDVADRFTRQAPIAAAFLGGNLTFLSWLPIGVGLTRSDVFPAWLGWVVALSAAAAWLGFLHVPVFQRFGGTLWPMSIALVGYFLATGR